MKILHITRYFQPGMGYQENGLLAAQMRLGHQVRLITSDRYHPHPDYKETMKMSESQRIVGVGHKEEDGLDVVRLKVVWEWPAHWWVVWRGLWRAVREFEPDIIHTHCAVIASSTFQILWGNFFRRYPIVVDDHNNYFNIEPYTPSKKFLYKFLFRRLMRPVLMHSVGRVLAISHEVRDYLNQELGISPDGVTINTLGTKPEVFQRLPEAGRVIRERLNIPQDAVVLVNAGKITRSKDNDVLLEAMAFGVPCVGVAGEAMEEIIVPEETGAIVPPENVDALAAQLVRVLRDRALGARWGLAARARVEQNYTWDRVVERLYPFLVTAQ